MFKQSLFVTFLMCLGEMEGFSSHIRVWKMEFIANLINRLRS